MRLAARKRSGTLARIYFMQIFWAERYSFWKLHQYQDQLWIWPVWHQCRTNRGRSSHSGEDESVLRKQKNKVSSLLPWFPPAEPWPASHSEQTGRMVDNVALWRLEACSTVHSFLSRYSQSVRLAGWLGWSQRVVEHVKMITKVIQNFVIKIKLTHISHSNPVNVGSTQGNIVFFP